MSALLDLYWHIGLGQFVQSPTRPTGIQLPTFYRQQGVQIRLHLIDTDPATRAAILQRDLSGYECVIGIGRESDATALAENNSTMTWDADNTCFGGLLNLYTAEMEAALADASAWTLDLTFYFRVQTGPASTDERIPGLARCVVSKTINTLSSGVPESVTASQFAALLITCVQDSESIAWSRTGNRVQGHAELFADAGLIVTLRTEIVPTTAGGHLVTPGPRSTARVLDSLAGRRQVLQLRVRGVIECNHYTGGAAYGLMYQGGTPVSPTINVWQLTISSPAQTLYLNHDPSTPYARKVDYLLSVVADAGATLTLIGDPQDTAIDPGGRDIVVEGVYPSPAAFDGQFIELAIANQTMVAPRFIDLADGPPTLLGQGGKALTVKNDGTGLELTPAIPFVNAAVTTTNATPTDLAATFGSLVLANNTTRAFRLLVKAERTDTHGEVDMWTFDGLLQRDANAASTTLNLIPAATTGLTPWTLVPDADPTAGGLKLTFTGEAAKTINVTAMLLWV